MKALKLKSSPDDNPIWGYISYRGEESFGLDDTDEVIVCDAPDVFPDIVTIEVIIHDNSHSPIKNIENFELVTVELTIKR